MPKGVYARVPKAAKPCTKCGITDRLKSGGCRPCKRLQNAGQTPHEVLVRGLKAKYRLSIEDYVFMVVEQDNKCLICATEMTPPCVDHCHTTNKVRGLLCKLCNSGIGKLGDTAAAVQRAVAYLKKAEAA